MKHLLPVLVLGSSLITTPALASDWPSDIVAALEAMKGELANGVMSTNAVVGMGNTASIESLVAVGYRITRFNVSNDLDGQCAVTFIFGNATSKSYRVENKEKSWFKRLCP